MAVKSRVTTGRERTLIARVKKLHTTARVADLAGVSPGTVNNMVMYGPIRRGRIEYPGGFFFHGDTIQKVVNVCKQLEGNTKVESPKLLTGRQQKLRATRNTRINLEHVSTLDLLAEVTRRVKSGDI